MAIRQSIMALESYQFLGLDLNNLTVRGVLLSNRNPLLTVHGRMRTEPLF